MAQVEMHHLEQIHNLMTSEKDVNSHKYEAEEAVVIGRIMEKLNKQITMKGFNFVQQYIVHKGLKVFGEKGKKAVYDEMNQLHTRNFFVPVSVNLLSAE